MRGCAPCPSWGLYLSSRSENFDLAAAGFDTGYEAGHAPTGLVSVCSKACLTPVTGQCAIRLWTQAGDFFKQEDAQPTLCVRWKCDVSALPAVFIRFAPQQVGIARFAVTMFIAQTDWHVLRVHAFVSP